MSARVPMHTLYLTYEPADPHSDYGGYDVKLNGIFVARRKFTGSQTDRVQEETEELLARLLGAALVAGAEDAWTLDRVEDEE